MSWGRLPGFPWSKESTQGDPERSDGITDAPGMGNAVFPQAELGHKTTSKEEVSTTEMPCPGHGLGNELQPNHREWGLPSIFSWDTGASSGMEISPIISLSRFILFRHPSTNTRSLPACKTISPSTASSQVWYSLCPSTVLPWCVHCME